MPNPLWLRLARAAPHALRRLGLVPRARSLFAPEARMVSLADLTAAHWLLLGRGMAPEETQLYRDRLSRRPLRFEELAEEMLHRPEFEARFGRLVRSSEDDVVETTLDGIVFFLRRSDVLISGPVLAGNPHEPHVWSALEPLLLPGAGFVDVGANLGFLALPAARKVGPAGRVFAVEPLADNVRLLCAAAARNRLENLQVMPFAASDRPGVIAVVTRQATSNSFTPPDRDVRPGAPCAPAASLDELLGGYGRIDVVKIDVEGHEPAVIEGARSLLARHRPALLVEFNPFGLESNFGREPRELAEWLVEYGGGVTAVVRDAEPFACGTGRDVMRAWEAANRRAGLDGRLHLDLLARPAPRPGRDDDGSDP